MKNAREMTGSGKNRMGILCMAISLLAVMLTACGSGEKIYEDDRIKATVTESNGQLDLSVRIRSSTAPMREAVRKNLTEGELYHDFRTLMSDGIYYQYQDGTLDQEGGVYIYVYSSEAELEQALGQSLPNSSGISWPEGGHNFVLTYRPDAGTPEGDGAVDIQAAAAPEAVTGEELQVSWDVRVNYGTDRSNSYMDNITEDVIHEGYTSAQGLAVDLFMDERTGQVLVIWTEENVCCTWSLTGELTMDSVKKFVDTIEL
ncbi:MAG TPA: hypothetical protein IAA55_07395 [Candidatus Pullilachnospira gallistercoris]|uniref:DUF4367 domain-containing protein n=1 Tax=Candidatus Pullilachnospira gallistercoris TaxID=2840911 RepID=A0A9D1JB20_9FIRM|nr:hypothetical protein [Candidatus Pullilachnospira gallistercoris]